MLKEQTPNDVLVEWAKQLVKHPYDRPWFFIDPPCSFVQGVTYSASCRCSCVAHLKGYNCVDNNGWVFIGQCGRCETVIWSYLEKKS